MNLPVAEFARIQPRCKELNSGEFSYGEWQRNRAAFLCKRRKKEEARIMTTATETIQDFANRDYQWGFVTDVEVDAVPKGLNEDIIRMISAKKKEPEFMLQWRLKAFRHWLTMKEPRYWPNVQYPPIDYQNLVYYSAPKPKKQLASLDEVDPEMRRTFEKLGISLDEQKRLSGVAVDAVFDSVSVATTFREKLAELGIIFCSFCEAVRNHPELVKKYLGSVVPYNDNYFATLNSAVFSDGSFAYIPKGVRCPMELSTYFRINAKETGQFERTLIIADEGSYVSYLEGCTAPMRDENQLHAAVVELVAVGKSRRSNIRPCRTGIPATRKAKAASTTSSPSAAPAVAGPARFPGRRSKPARPSPGNIQAASCRATTRSANFTPWP